MAGNMTNGHNMPTQLLEQRLQQQLGALVFQVLVLQQENEVLKARLAQGTPVTETQT